MEFLRMLTVIIIVLIYLIVAGKAQFTIHPVSVERAEGLEEVFSCQYQEEGVTVTYDWAINNNISGADTETVRVCRPSSPGGPTTLIILATPEHNNSVVQCMAIIRNGIAIVRSEVSTTATLTVRATIITDVLTAPNTITVMWNALPRTGYCVHINRTTLDSTETVVLDSVCELTNKYIFMYPNPISVCDRFSFTVTPTDGEMRGTTSEPVTGFFTRVEGSIEERHHRVRESGENKSVGFKATIPSCTNFTRYRVDSDLLTPSISRSITDPLLFNGSLSFSLPTDKMTEYSVTLTDENGIDLVFENIKISTFDVQDLQVSECPGGGDLCLKIEYVKGTVSPGALVCVIRITDGELDFASMRLVTIPRSRSENFTIHVPSGSYSVIAFDLENSFVPRIPISMAADVKNMTMKNMTMATTDGEDPTSPPSSEGISATKLPNEIVEVTCSDSDLNCLALFQSTSSVLDGVIVGFINSTYNSTVLSLKDYGDGYVVVYSWNSSQSIFEGEVSLIMQLDPPTSAPTTPPTSDPQTDPPPPDMESLPTSVIAGIIVPLVLIMILMMVIIIIVLGKKVKRGGKVFHSSNSEGGSVDVGASITSKVAFYDVARPENMSLEYNTAGTDDTSPPGYDVVRKENMPNPEYETVPSAKAGKPTPTTSENPPPLPPPMIRGDSEAPDLPPPYNPAVDNEGVVVMSVESSISHGVENQSVDEEVDESLKIDLSVSDTEHDGTTEEAISSSEAQPDVNHVDTVQGAEGGAGNNDHGGQEAMITAQDVGASIISPVALYDVACPEHMSLDCNTDDTPPPGYDVICKENMQSPEYETIPLAKAGEPTFTTSENLPPPMIRGLDNDVVLIEDTTSTSQAKNERTEDEGDNGLEAMITAQHQYTLVVPKPASSDAKVKDSSKVIYSVVDKEKLKPVAKAQGQYIPVETKPASSAAKVMDSTKVVYVVVDKDKLKPVDPNDPPALPPRRLVTNTEELHTEKTLALPPQRLDTNTEELHTEKTLLPLHHDNAIHPHHPSTRRP